MPGGHSTWGGNDVLGQRRHACGAWRSGLSYVLPETALVGVTVSRRAEQQRPLIAGLITQASEHSSLAPPVADISLWDEYYAPSYDLANDEGRGALALLARLESIVLDLVNPGEGLAIVGPSGSGKTTLLLSINLLETLDGGKHSGGGDITIDTNRPLNGQKGQIRALRQQVGFVFQNFNLFPHRSVLDNIIDGPLVVKKEPREVFAHPGHERTRLFFNKFLGA